MINHQLKIVLLTCIGFGFQTPATNAQFLETFEGEPSTEWTTFSGAGEAVSSLDRMDGWMRFTVDATDDLQNVWWAIAQTTLTDQLDLEPFTDDDSEYGLRMEARVRISHAPRRFNMQLRTQRYEGSYAGLMEFDIPEKDRWYTVSMTFNQLDIRPGDQITPHLAMMDWGPFVYTMDTVSLHLLQSIHGVGDVLALTMLYEIHTIDRFPSRGEFCSYGRLVKGQKSSAGKNYGTTNGRIGNAHLRWAFSEAAILFLRHTKPAEKYYNSLINRHGKSKALSIVAKRLGIAVYYMLKRQKPFNLNMFLSGTKTKQTI